MSFVAPRLRLTPNRLAKYCSSYTHCGEFGKALVTDSATLTCDGTCKEQKCCRGCLFCYATIFNGGAAFPQARKIKGRTKFWKTAAEALDIFLSVQSLCDIAFFSDVCSKKFDESHGCGWNCDCPNVESCLNGTSKSACTWKNDQCELVMEDLSECYGLRFSFF